MSKIIDSCSIDAILVGDSLGMVALGYENTLPVTINDMVHHSKAVANGAKNSFIICDMPFMSYTTSNYDAVKNAGILIKEGMCHAVKLEGGCEISSTVKEIVNSKIPVMGHIGLTPQSVNNLGGYKVQGKNVKEIKSLIESAKALEDSGVFSIVLECIPYEIAKLIDESISIPTIGIGSGKYTTGQILVLEDMLGLFDNLNPKFVKQYCNLNKEIQNCINEYISDVCNGNFPLDSHSFSIN